MKEGQTVAQLETADLQADVALARAELHAAEAAWPSWWHGSRPDEIAAALAAMQKAEANYAELKTAAVPRRSPPPRPNSMPPKSIAIASNATSIGTNKLRRPTPAPSRRTTRSGRAAYRMANQRYLQAMKRYELVKEGPRQEDIAQAKAAMEQAEAQYRLVKEGPRKEDIDQARAKVEQAKATLQSAETKLGYATVTSPLTGVVLSKNIEPGEYVAAGTPVVTVADIENLWLRAYVDETRSGQTQHRPGHRGRDHHRRLSGQGLHGPGLLHLVGAGVHAQVGARPIASG